MNCTRLFGNALDPIDLTEAEIAGRENAWWIFEELKRELPDFAGAHFAQSGPSVGCRETRRIVGDYQLTESDVRNAPDFPDVVGLGAWPMDVHPSDGRVGFHPHKDTIQVPYPYPLRALLPRKLENVLAVGRCASATQNAHGSSRVNGTAMMMGEASGTLCALAHAMSVAPREVPLIQLQDALIASGALLDPHALPPRPVAWRLGHFSRDAGSSPS